jgi:ATP/maltotriose-dependent transcriptional regulator MalT
MATRDVLIGRDVEATQLERAMRRAEAGAGSLVLVSGEAGVGKTRLAEELASQTEATVLWGAARQRGTAPYAPLAEALRSYLRQEPEGLTDTALRDHLALLMPELGEAATQTDRATILEAIRSALATIAGAGPVLLVLDDLHWSDDATLDLVGFIADPLSEMPVLVIGIYRSDELPREHSLRRARAELRRSDAFEELALQPLGLDETAAIGAELLGGRPADSLAQTIHDRTQGVPFFVREVTAALIDSRLVAEGADGYELSGEADVPVPDTVREAVLMRASVLSSEGRAAAEAAAVAGESFRLELVAAQASEAGVSELIDSALIRETEPGVASFRHSLAREAVYEDVPWLRRQTMHRSFADALDATGGPSVEIAAHWQGAREDGRAREALLRAAEEFCAVHAYRDAARAGHQALELWAPGDDITARPAALERYASCAQLAGDLPEAKRAWREVADLRRAEGDGRELAEAQRQLAAVHALEGDRPRAVSARRAAADGFAAEGLPVEAAADRLVAASYLQRIGDHSEAEALARAAGEEARGAGRTDLEAEAKGLQGVALAKRGDLDAGLELARAGLSLALKHGMTAQAGSLYQRFGTVLEAGASYRDAQDAMEKAFDLCQASGASETERVCLECMAYLLRELGEWDRCAKLCEKLTEEPALAPGDRMVADGVLGSIEAFRGRNDEAHGLLGPALEAAIRSDLLSTQVDAAAALAWLADAEGDTESAVRHCEFVLQRWAKSEDHHYSIWGLRWSAGFLARREDDRARAFCEALAKIAESGQPFALAALADALGVTAMAEGDADTAAKQHERALELHEVLDVPFERSQVLLNAGTALAAAGHRTRALERLAGAHREAKRLGARPLAARAAEKIAALGESVERTLGKRAAAELEGAGLSRRELEVMRLVGSGRTNREIAEKLVLSPRTVDMHVRNIFTKFGCRSRVEATRKAITLGLLEDGEGAGSPSASTPAA